MRFSRAYFLQMVFISSCFLIFLFFGAFSQIPVFDPESYAASVTFQESQTTTKEKAAKILLGKIEESIASGDIKTFNQYLSNKVYLNLFTGESGYFSAEQSFYILKNFFVTHVPTSFSFSSSNVAAENPYGVGTFKYILRGRRGAAQIFISLNEDQNEWKINQVTIAQR